MSSKDLQAAEDLVKKRELKELKRKEKNEAKEESLLSFVIGIFGGSDDENGGKKEKSSSSSSSSSRDSSDDDDADEAAANEPQLTYDWSAADSKTII